MPYLVRELPPFRYHSAHVWAALRYHRRRRLLQQWRSARRYRGRRTFRRYNRRR